MAGFWRGEGRIVIRDRSNSVDIFYWTDGRFGYALSGNTGREDMLPLATLVYRQHDK